MDIKLYYFDLFAFSIKTNVVLETPSIKPNVVLETFSINNHTIINSQINHYNINNNDDGDNITPILVSNKLRNGPDRISAVVPYG